MINILQKSYKCFLSIKEELVSIVEDTIKIIRSINSCCKSDTSEGQKESYSVKNLHEEKASDHDVLGHNIYYEDFNENPTS